MRVKICGITQPDQGRAIAQLGASALGFICATASPRYVSPTQIRAIAEALLPDFPIDRVGVFVDATVEEIEQVVAIAHLTAVQLHGNESPAFCQQVRQALPQVELIKALRVREAATLDLAHVYAPHIDTLLLDAYHPHLYGGTGATLDWAMLNRFNPGRPWLLAGGLTPANVQHALQQAQPHGIDLSSGVERAPGDKDLVLVARLLEAVAATAAVAEQP
ncbi:MAG: phosphoribosylanthranilate isomerase [Cyanobacteria bacterium J069]|nr:MAG: phosphoribosylanthranilate isomerase [Cyanobacteria bacterium J069]